MSEEEIDELACELGDCVYDFATCGWRNPASHPGKYRVVYTVKFECDVVLDGDDHWEDKISDIDIPEGGQNGSVYCEDTFRIETYAHEDEE